MHYVYWFRKDLRLKDNRALSEFIKIVSEENTFSFLYIKNKNSYKYFGGKRVSFLIECLRELRQELKENSFELQIAEGISTEVFSSILSEYKNVSLFVNEQNEPYCIGRDEKIKEIIIENGGAYNSCTDSTIFSFGEIKNGDGIQYKIFTPFKNQALKVISKNHYESAECDLTALNKENEKIFKDLNCCNIDSEYNKLSGSNFLKGGRKEGINLLKDFYEIGINSYKSKRDFPSVKGTSLLSAHLHFGTVGIREAYRTANKKLKDSNGDNDEVQTWINELLWREFYSHISFHNPQVMFESFKKEFDKIEWNYSEDDFVKWCEGKTGFPIVDAGMRQLKAEGWMHNRVRMITAMFLTKDLFIDWRYGEKYFAENLIDLDFANNNGGWQWSASTGVDAQPFFRIFNPCLQSKNFDPDGNYIRKYVPELKALPELFIHEPHIMSPADQKKYKVLIGKDYPAPIVDHKTAKEFAIKKFKELKEIK